MCLVTPLVAEKMGPAVEQVGNMWKHRLATIWKHPNGAETPAIRACPLGKLRAIFSILRYHEPMYPLIWLEYPQSGFPQRINKQLQ